MNRQLICRILNGFGANVFGHGATALIQIISLPLFLHAWGLDLYGEWLVLYAIPAYFSLSDMGFSSVAANEVTMLAGRGEYDKGLVIFQSVWLFLSLVSLFLMVLVVAGTLLLPLDQWFHFQAISHRQTVLSLQILGLYVLMNLQSNMVSVGFRSSGHYARGAYYANIMRLAEFLGLALAVLLGGGPVAASVAYLGIRFFGTGLMYAGMRKVAPQLWFGLARVQWSEVKRLAKPSIAFMAFPVSNALSLQGMVVLIGVVLGPVATVTFSTIRTLSRFPMQVTNAINSTVWPEISTAFGAGDAELTRRLHVRTIQSAFILSFSANLFIAVFGPWILELWSHGKVPFQSGIGHLLLAVAFFNTIWSAASILLAATNLHQRMAVWNLVTTIGALCVGYALMPYLQLTGTGVALLLPEVLMIVFVLVECKNILGQSSYAYIKQMFYRRL